MISLKTEKIAYFYTYIIEILRNPQMLRNKNLKNIIVSITTKTQLNRHFLQGSDKYYVSLSTINVFELDNFYASSIEFVGVLRDNSKKYNQYAALKCRRL